MSFITSLVNELKKIWAWLDSPKTQAALQQAAALALEAAPIVAEISLLVPNSTFAEVAAVYQKYGVPFAATVTADPTQIGNYLLNLATIVLQKNLPKTQSSVAVSLLNTAVQLAVTALKASGGVPVTK
jgi:hypothetical protein